MCHDGLLYQDHIIVTYRISFIIKTLHSFNPNVLLLGFQFFLCAYWIVTHVANSYAAGERNKDHSCRNWMKCQFNCSQTNINYIIRLILKQIWANFYDSQNTKNFPAVYKFILIDLGNLHLHNKCILCYFGVNANKKTKTARS